MLDFAHFWLEKGGGVSHTIPSIKNLPYDLLIMMSKSILFIHSTITSVKKIILHSLRSQGCDGRRMLYVCQFYEWQHLECHYTRVTLHH